MTVLVLMPLQARSWSELQTSTILAALLKLKPGHYVSSLLQLRYQSSF